MDDEIDTILKLPYARLVYADKNGGYTALILEFPGCVSGGETEEAALTNLELVTRDWIKVCLEQGTPVPPNKFELLPTNKINISFSEAKIWKECSFRHKLKHIDKVGEDLPGLPLDFGTSMHEANEHFLNTRTVDKKIFFKRWHELYSKHILLSPTDFTLDAFMEYAKQGKEILDDVGAFYDEQFHGWEPVAAEFPLFEQIEKHKHAFKGYIDAIIRVPGKNGKHVYWILDVKTTSWGWTAEKKSDEMIKAQLIYYKYFWSKKAGIDPKDIKCGFVLFKRVAKPGKHCELLPVSVGDVTTGRALKVIDNMFSSMQRGIAIKNKNACKFCQYKDTEWCT